MSRLPVDCSCLIFHWLELSEKSRLSRTNKFWYSISDKKQAYPSCTFPSFSKDEFDLLAYDRWVCSQRSVMLTPNAFVRCSHSRIIQHQEDITLIFPRCRTGQYHGLGDGIRESEFQLALTRFRYVRFLRIDFDDTACRCCSSIGHDSLLSGTMHELIVRAIQTLSRHIVSFQLCAIPLLASQIFDADVRWTFQWSKQVISMPNLQHAVISTEPKDVYAILKHGFHISSQPRDSSISSSSTPCNSSFGGLLRLVEPREKPFYEPDIEDSRRNVPILTDPNFFQSLPNAPYHVWFESVEKVVRLAPWALKLPPNLLRIHLASLQLTSSNGSMKVVEFSHRFKPDPELTDETLNLNSPPLNLFQSFSALTFEIDPSGLDIKVFTEQLTSLIPPLSYHQSRETGQLVEELAHPYFSLASFELKAPLLLAHHPPIRLHEFNRIFPNLDRILLGDIFRVDVNLDCSRLSWLSMSLGREWNQAEMSDREYLRRVVLGLPQLRTLELQIDFTHPRDDAATMTADEIRSYYEMLECLVLSNSNLAVVHLVDGYRRMDAAYRRILTIEQLEAHQRFLIYLHLLWHQLLPSHDPQIGIRTLHPTNFIQLFSVHLPFTPNLPQHLQACLEQLDRNQPLRRSTRKPQSPALRTRLEQWFHRITDPFKDDPTSGLVGETVEQKQQRLQVARDETDVKKYLAREQQAMTARINVLLKSVGRTKIQPRTSSFAFTLAEYF